MAEGGAANVMVVAIVDNGVVDKVGADVGMGMTEGCAGVSVIRGVEVIGLRIVIGGVGMGEDIDGDEIVGGWRGDCAAVVPCVTRSTSYSFGSMACSRIYATYCCVRGLLAN